MNPIGIFGGTFDPIHFGHLRTAFELLHFLGLAEMRFVPAGEPPHRDRPRAEAAVRLRLVRAAVDDQAGFVVDDREVRRGGPSYSVLTLAELRGEMPGRSLCLSVGMDAFLGLPQWYRWREILDLAHIVVAHRPGWRAPQEGVLGELLRTRGTDRVADLHEAQAGRIFVQPVTQLEIASTELRNLLAAGVDPRYLVPDEVRRLILETGSYRRPTTMSPTR
ncbi:MAG TPA: nicotinate-nucleotide adenylyltransferase [Steroidobacteraceae bacterium]|nr:nicotinate-nucleotide adenylyltransferase [Steroidobacteraceae bacterium]